MSNREILSWERIAINIFCMVMIAVTVSVVGAFPAEAANICMCEGAYCLTGRSVYTGWEETGRTGEFTRKMAGRDAEVEVIRRKTVTYKCNKCGRTYHMDTYDTIYVQSLPKAVHGQGSR